MNKLLSLSIAGLSLIFQANAQFLYSTSWAGYTQTYSLTSGFPTTSAPGFLYFGYQQSLQLGNFPWWPQNMNFYIKGTGVTGLWAEYKVYEGSVTGCNGLLSQVVNGYGISAIEANGHSAIRYAVAGAFDHGCYFAGINPVGAVVASMQYKFPSLPNPNLSAPCKPLIVQDPQTSHYFIIGSFDNDLYVVHTDATGNLVWSQRYKVPATVTPADVIINPYNPNSIVIAGTVSGPNLNTDGFFMSVDGIQGNVLQFMTFGTPGTNEQFSAIIPGAAVNPANIAGFVIAGSTQNAGATAPWMLKITSTGSLLWSNRVDPSSGTNDGFVDVVERFNTLGNYEYYGLIKSAAGMVVTKHDDAGFPFPLTGTISSNEFIYDLSGSAVSVPACISTINGPPGAPEMGFQVYGTAYNLPGIASSYMVKTYFNGETNCSRTLTIQNPVAATPVTISNWNPQIFSGLSACSNFQVVAWFPGGTLNFPCSGAMLSGSNQRLNLTAVNEQTDHAEVLTVYPNPAKDKLNISVKLMADEVATIEFTDLLGNKILGLPAISGNEVSDFRQELDLRNTAVVPGIYFISLNKNGFLSKYKVVVE